MDKYKLLKDYYYGDPKDYDAEYLRRFNDQYSCRISFFIGDNQSFFCETPEITRLIVQIYKYKSVIMALRYDLPDDAIYAFMLNSLIGEIEQTNGIEGIHSSRQEIADTVQLVRDDYAGKKRFRGLVRKYLALSSDNINAPNSCSDIRKLYDETFLEEVLDNNPKDCPDGKLFRLNSVYVRDARQNIIHEGLWPEERIIDAMNNALGYLHSGKEDMLCRISAFHYFFAYIHPFYDGNGRMSRYISSLLLAREIDPLLGFRLSYTIKGNVDKYYRAFKQCNDPRNRGDITPFISFFLESICLACENLIDALSSRQRDWHTFIDKKEKLDFCKDKLCNHLYDLLLSATLFSFDGISTKDLLKSIGKSRTTLQLKLEKFSELGLLKVATAGREKKYSLVLDKLKEI